MKMAVTYAYFWKTFFVFVVSEVAALTLIHFSESVGLFFMVVSALLAIWICFLGLQNVS